MYKDKSFTFDGCLYCDNELLKTFFKMYFLWSITNIIGIWLDYTAETFAWMMHVKIAGMALILLYYLYRRWREYVGTSQSDRNLFA